jgi:hypothetical protein
MGEACGFSVGSATIVDMNWQWTLAFCIVFSLLLLSGCQTGPWARAVPEERVYEASPEVVLAEVRALLEARNYRIVREAPAAGKIEALSLIRTDGPSRGAHQGRVRATVVEEAPKRTRVLVEGTFLEESEIPVHGRATFERPWSAVFYRYFFEDLSERLEVASHEEPEQS